MDSKISTIQEVIESPDDELEHARLVLDTLLEEYRQTREDIRTASKYVQDIANFAVLLFGGVAAFLTSAWPRSGEEGNPLLAWILLLAPVLFLLLIWLGFGSELWILRMVRFQETYLRPHIASLCREENVLGWEHWLRDECKPGFFGLPERLSFPPDHWPRYVLVLLPGISSLLAFILLRTTRSTQYVLCVCTGIDWNVSLQVFVALVEAVLYTFTMLYVFGY